MLKGNASLSANAGACVAQINRTTHAKLIKQTHAQFAQSETAHAETTICPSAGTVLTTRQAREKIAHTDKEGALSFKCVIITSSEHFIKAQFQASLTGTL